MTQNATESNLTTNQLKAIELMMTGNSNTAIASELGIDRSTLYRWKQEPGFIVEVNKRVNECSEQARVSTSYLLTEAIETLTKAVKDNPRIAFDIAKGMGLFGGISSPLLYESISQVEQELENQAKKCSQRLFYDSMIL